MCSGRKVENDCSDFHHFLVEQEMIKLGSLPFKLRTKIKKLLLVAAGSQFCVKPA
jgi:hypothetical protein